MVKGVHNSSKRTVYRAVADINSKSVEKVWESDKKLEDYIRYLNSEHQYGSLLYDNEELIIPETEAKRCTIYVLTSPVPSWATNYWDGLEDIKPGTEKKIVLFLFEAHADAVFAFQYSLPVICLDACFIRGPNTTDDCHIQNNRRTRYSNVLRHCTKREYTIMVFLPDQLAPSFKNDLFSHLRLEPDKLYE